MYSHNSYETSIKILYHAIIITGTGKSTGTTESSVGTFGYLDCLTMYNI